MSNQESVFFAVLASSTIVTYFAISAFKNINNICKRSDENIAPDEDILGESTPIINNKNKILDNTQSYWSKLISRFYPKKQNKITTSYGGVGV